MIVAPTVPFPPQPLIKIPRLLRKLKNPLRLKPPYQFHIPLADLGTSINAILVQNILDRPTLDLAETGDDTARAVAALVAVQVEGVVGAVEEEEQGFAEGVAGGLDVRGAGLVGRDVDAVPDDGGGVQPGRVLFGGFGGDEGSKGWCG